MKPSLVTAAVAIGVIAGATLNLASTVSAATFTIAGGELFTLGLDHDPALTVADLGPSATVLRNGTLSLSDPGVVTFSYAGFEASYANELWVAGAKYFEKANVNAPFSLTFAAGALPFEFRTAGQAGAATNGDSTGYYRSIALYQSTPTTVYALLNDAATGDKDYDDLVVRMDVAPVPLPAAAWLLLGGMAGLGAVARRRRKSVA